MIIVLEGIRKSGKTTFADMMVEYCTERQIPAFKFYDRDLQSYPVNQMEANYVSCMQFIKAAETVQQGLKKLSKEPVILFDRFHISEIVFGYQLRGYNSGRLMGKVDQYLADIDAKLILFDSQTSRERMKPGEDTYQFDFVNLCSHSEIEAKMRVNLDCRDGKLTFEDIKEALERFGF